jgi:hypothetical protein
MRIVWFLCWMAMISTARAQPAPAEPPPEAAPTLEPDPTAAASSAPAPVAAPAPSVPPASPPAPTSSEQTPPLFTAPAPASDPAEPERESYGWQIAIADAAGLMLLFGTDHSQGSATAGVIVYMLGGPVIHAAHDQPARGGASLALRLALPVASAWLWGRCSSHEEECENDGAVAVGLVLGAVTAMVLDATALSHPIKARPAQLTWTPRVTATRQQVGLGVLGQF